MCCPKHTARLWQRLDWTPVVSQPARVSACFPCAFFLGSTMSGAPGLCGLNHDGCHVQINELSKLTPTLKELWLEVCQSWNCQ